MYKQEKKQILKSKCTLCSTTETLQHKHIKSYNNLVIYIRTRTSAKLIKKHPVFKREAVIRIAMSKAYAYKDCVFYLVWYAIT